MRTDSRGFPVTTRSSGQHCSGCGVVFAFGHLPLDGSLECRDCRGETATAADPSLFEGDL